MSDGAEFVILDVDDHVVYRRGLRMLLESTDPTVRVVEAGTLEEALTALSGDRASIVLLELAVCGEATLETVTRIVDHIGTPVVVFSKYACDDRIITALQGGASGFVNETADVEVFLHSLRRAAAGEYILDPSLVREVVHTMRELAVHARVSGDNDLELMTRREVEVLRLVCAGRTNRQIGHGLGISESTVKNHLQAIFRKLRVFSRSEAASKAFQRGLLDDTPCAQALKMRGAQVPGAQELGY